MRRLTLCNGYGPMRCSQISWRDEAIRSFTTGMGRNVVSNWRSLPTFILLIPMVLKSAPSSDAVLTSGDSLPTCITGTTSKYRSWTKHQFIGIDELAVIAWQAYCIRPRECRIYGCSPAPPSLMRLPTLMDWRDL